MILGSGDLAIPESCFENVIQGFSFSIWVADVRILLGGFVALDLLISGFKSFLEVEVYSHLRLKIQNVESIKIINFSSGLAVRLDGRAYLPGGSRFQDCVYFYPALGTSLEVVNSSSEVVCPLLQE